MTFMQNSVFSSINKAILSFSGLKRVIILKDKSTGLIICDEISSYIGILKFAYFENLVSFYGTKIMLKRVTAEYFLTLTLCCFWGVLVLLTNTFRHSSSCTWECRRQLHTHWFNSFKLIAVRSFSFSTSFVVEYYFYIAMFYCMKIRPNNILTYSHSYAVNYMHKEKSFGVVDNSLCLCCIEMHCLLADHHCKKLFLVNKFFLKKVFPNE